MERTETVRKSVKRKPPVIRQTLTSIYRLAKANPLLFIDDASTFQGPGSVDLTNVKLPDRLKPFPISQIDNTKTENKVIDKSQKVQEKPIVKNPVKVQEKFFKNNLQPKKLLQSKSQPNLKPVNLLNKNEVQKKSFAQKAVKRRSLSADNYDRRKTGNMKQSSSATLLTGFQKNEIKNISPIAERKVKFQTPVRVNNNNNTSTPFVRKHSTPYAVQPINHYLHDLQKKLNDWLKKRKIPTENYHHLKCFGLHGKNKYRDEEDKENVEEVVTNTSYDDLRVDTPMVVRVKPEDLRLTVHGCLDDLRKLVLEGYSTEQSEAWLNVIREKYCYLDNEPEYWECRAAIEQNRNNLTSAVECLRTAIVQGAEVKSIDRSLEQLLQKFSLLNINTPAKITENGVKNDRARIVKDARNVFKSSIIQFAVQERNMKKKQMNTTDDEKKFTATPVRRSTRLTPSRYRVTPKVQVCSSLLDLDDSVRSNMDFYGNRVLNVRFSNIAQLD